MILREALASAKMHLAGVADEPGLCAALRPVAARDAVTLLVHMLGEVLASQRMGRMAARSTLAGYMFGRQLLQQLQHELLLESLRLGRIGATEVR
jgi:hypothetical protein